MIQRISDSEKGVSYTISIIFIAVVVITVIVTSIVGASVKKPEKSVYVYSDKDAKLKYNNISIKVSKGKDFECSDDSSCTRMEDHKMYVKVNNKMYEFNANDDKYKKIEGTKNYVYATIKKGKINVGVARDYSIVELLVLGKDKAGRNAEKFLKGIRDWLGSHTNWTGR